MHEEILVALVIILGLGIVSQLVSWWVKLPAILFLLLTGIALGPVSGVIRPDELFGDLLFPMVSLSVAVILFEGSLTLNFRQLQGIQHVVLSIISIGMLVTWVSVAVLTHYLAGFPWALSWLFGAIMVVTGPTVVVPMLRTIRPNSRISHILRWEGILIDPIGALLAVLVFEYIVAIDEGLHVPHGLLLFGGTMLTGFVAGALGGWLLGRGLQNYRIPEYLQSPVALVWVLVVFVISNVLSEESGLLAVTVMGVWLANTRGLDIDDILSFKENLSILLVSFLFIVLAARIDFELFHALGWGGVLVFLGLQFLVRPLKILISTLGSSLSWQEKAMLSWIAPRGIVAASISAVFAIRLEQIDMPGAHLLVPLTFMLIIGTVVFQSATARPLANYLGVAEPEPQGFLVVGANPLGRMIALTLQEQGFQVLLIGSSWDEIRAARMAGIDTFFGEATSRRADLHLDLVGLGRLIAVSAQEDVNQLAGLRFQSEFGKPNIFRLCTGQHREREHSGLRPVGQCLFGTGYDYELLSRWLDEGAKIRRTRLSDSFSFEAYQSQYEGRAILLFCRNPRGRLYVMTEGSNTTPSSGWEVFALARPVEESREAVAA
ncbi:MAG: sodium:proton antiporter [Thiothrix sp.]|nr:sodium:proton antiporter [Thiothrix sp.]HPQ94289.1 cation:proton antiporter [Thiolinea sp.]